MTQAQILAQLTNVQQFFANNTTKPDAITNKPLFSLAQAVIASVNNSSGTFTNLIVSGTSTLTGAVAMSSTLAVTGATTLTGALTTSAGIANSSGLVGTPSYSFTGATNTGMYKVSATQIGFSVAGTLRGGFSSSTGGLFTNAIDEQATGAGIAIGQAILQRHTATAVAISTTLSAAGIVSGYFTVTALSGAVTLTFPTTLKADIGATAGQVIELYIDNSANSGNVTMAVGLNAVLSDLAVTNAASSGRLTVVFGQTGIARYTLVFSSTAVYTVTRTA